MRHDGVFVPKKWLGTGLIVFYFIFNRDPQRSMGSYLDHESLHIIRYLARYGIDSILLYGTPNVAILGLC